jgi:hypothetical protein
LFQFSIKENYLELNVDISSGDGRRKASADGEVAASIAGLVRRVIQAGSITNRQLDREIETLGLNS